MDPQLVALQQAVEGLNLPFTMQVVPNVLQMDLQVKRLRLHCRLRAYNKMAETIEGLGLTLTDAQTDVLLQVRREHTIALREKNASLRQMRVNSGDNTQLSVAINSMAHTELELLMNINDRKHCSVCGRHRADELKFQRCGGCRHRDVRYCGEECQLADWKTHKLFCKVVQGATASKSKAKAKSKAK
jgi:hypothetical protein